jgi:membrane-bound lytic murein transglycosylase A
VIRPLIFICLIYGLPSCEAIAGQGEFLIAQASSTDLLADNPAAAPINTEPATPFRTKYAYFQPTNFSDLPGWRDDRLGDAWPAFRQSCAALQRKNAWVRPCSQSRGMDGSDDRTLRIFFEQEFILYQIYNTDRMPAGVITGYYEPLLNGSRHYGAPYIHPVHAVPDDMLYLDARTLPAQSSSEISVRVEGRDVIALMPSESVGPGTYKLEITGGLPDIRTRKFRLRIDGERVVPYFSRQEIDRGQMSRAKVLAWVDNPAALYSMQIQGSGKVRLPDGELIRVAYGEQNGHPFYPSLQSLPQIVNSQGRRQVIATRGLAPTLAREEDRWAAMPDQAIDRADADAAPLTRGLRTAPRQYPGGASEVDLVIAALMPGGKLEATQSQNSLPPVPPAVRATPQNSGSVRHTAAPNTQQDHRVEEPFSNPMPVADAANNSDPSYVFFRSIPNSDSGPIGALGVPLTAGRSVAVDPRTTPLGFPVFISTKQSGTHLNRLMLAQDTGGAIRGAVRADYFWGFGPKAFLQASQMKEEGRMWLLIPKGQKIPSNTSGAQLRGIGGPGRGAEPAECVVPDPELCVE